MPHAGSAARALAPHARPSPSAFAAAPEVTRQCGVREVTVPITDTAAPLLAAVPASDRVRRGNILARLRMIVLYDQSAAFEGLVLGTGNKTEILLGYTTLFRDSPFAPHH